METKKLSNSEDRRAITLLLLGVLLGIVLAATGLFDTNTTPTEGDIAASVNDWTISKDEYFRFLTALAQDKRNPLTVEDKRHVLDRMIEEKLLIQRGVEIDLIQSDPRVRKTIANAMIQSVVTEAESLQAEDEDLQAFFQENKNYFAKPARLRVQQLVFQAREDEKRKQNEEGVYRRARAAFAALESGMSVVEVEQEFADSTILQVPNAKLPPHKLREYIGPELLALAEKLPGGSISKPQQTASGYAILLVLDNESSTDVKFDSVREQVASEYQRREGEKALRAYLENLRDEAEVTIAADLFQ